MGKQKQATIGSWMSRERLIQLHLEFDEQLGAALLQKPIDQKRVAELKKKKLLCKDLLAQQPSNMAEKKPSAEVIPFKRKKKTATSLFLGKYRLTAKG